MRNIVRVNTREQEIFNQQTQAFDFHPGPVFTPILVADEINRATPKTQAAMLEAMEERQVTSDGQSRPLPTPFFVLATQNPLELEGTYPLPEAQLDRFLFKVLVQMPSQEELVEIVDLASRAPPERGAPVTTANEIASLIKLSRDVVLPAEVRNLVARLVLATHPEDGGARLGAPLREARREPARRAGDRARPQGPRAHGRPTRRGDVESRNVAG